MRKLDKKDIEDILALTPMQEGILFHYLKAPGSGVYFEQLSLEISGKIELKLFEEALDFVIESNDMLRTLFRWEELETPLQIILKKYNLQLRYYDFTKTHPGEMKKRLQQLKNKDRKSKFQLEEVPFRVILCKVKEYKYVMIVSNHHILYDGWSTGIILNEFFNAYHDLCDGKKLVKPIKTKFRTFIQWIQDQDVVNQEKFWRNYLKNFDTQTGLSVKSRGKEKEITVTDTKNCQVRFEKNIKDKLEDFVKKHRITLAALLYSAWGILLQKYNNIDDVVFGTTVSGRAAKVPGIEDMVGLFINTIPLRIQTLPHEKTEDLLYRIDKALQMREKYETTSLVKIREYSDFSYNEELFDSIVVIENYPLEIKSMQGNSRFLIESHSLVECTHYDLTISITIEDDIEVIFRYNNTLFDQWIIERLSDHLVCVVQSMTEKPGEELPEIELIGEEEKRQILIHFNKPGFDYPVDKPIDELFAIQVSKIPDHIALVGMTGIVGMPPAKTNAVPLKNEVSVTYRELNERANQLALSLKEKGVPADTIMGIMVERFIEMIIGIMGILKAGGAYLPLDPGYPLERINYMLSDSRAKILLTTKKLAKVINFDIEMIYLDSSSPRASLYLSEECRPDFPNSQLPSFSHPPIFPSSLPSSLAYVIYTSGSTGNPKGVMVDHRNVDYLVYGLRERIYKNYGENLEVCLVSPFVFDASVKQIFGALLLGNCLCIVPEEERINGEVLFEFYKKHRVDISDGTPAHLQLLMENQGRECPGVRNYLIGGEPLSRETVDGFLNRFVEDDPGITNVYGPTECTVDASSYQVNRENIGLLPTIPIGNPLANCRIYVLAERNKLQPIGVPGELCIMGKGVSRGYLNQPELTYKKFEIINDKLKIKNGSGALWGDLNAFIEGEAHEINEFLRIGATSNKKFLRGGAGGAVFTKRVPPGCRRQKIYRTGDLARWLPKGNIEFLGRLDQQVKIRGHRIETGEIEHQLLNYRGVKEAVVTVKSSESAEHFLYAYFVSDSPGAIEISQLREYLQQKLPDYMIPGYFVNLEKIPLTASGKVDRKSLPQPDITSSKRYVMPGNEIEAALVDIWAEILEIDKNQIGIDDNFFELGGHSLKFAGLIGRIHKKLNIKVPFIKIFKIPTIRELAEYIHKEKERENEDEKILPGEKKEYYRLSSAQRRLFVLQQMETGCTAYNITGTLRVEGNVEKEKFAGVFKQLIRRHESLRTSFHLEEDQPVQKIHDKVDFEIEYDQSLVKGQGRGEVSSPIKVEKIIRDFIRPFDLSQPPLMRVGLIKEGKQKHILIVDMHHIISDGLSMEIFVKDFGVLYNGEDLPLLPVIRYKDYAEWETGKPVQERLKKQKEYWSKEFEGEVPVLMLPTDFSRPIVQDFAGHTLRFKLLGEQTQALKAAAFNKKTTLNVVLLTLYTIFLSKITGQEDIVVGVPSLARPHVETETIIGMFANSLALRNFPRGEKSIGEFITEVKARTLEAFANQDYPYENLVETLVIKRDTDRNPLFDTMFVFQEGEIKGLDIPGLNIKLYEYEGSTSKFDLTLLAFESNEILFFAFEYSTNLFKKETIERFFHYFKTIVSYLPGNINQKLNDIEIVTGEEKRQILEEFNDTASQYPSHKTLHELFAEQVEQTPERTALVGPFKINYKTPQYDTSFWQEYSITHRAGSLLDSDTFNIHLSYNQLNREAGKLALVLKERGVLKNAIIAIMMERSVEMIVAIMGILKAGGAYMPISSEYPEERIKYMLSDSNVNVLITSRTLAEKVKKFRSLEVKGDFQTIFLDSYEFSNFASSHRPNFSSSPSSNLAYIIYTSGSTGKPKGVPVEHFSVVNLAFCQGKQFAINERDRILQFSSICFDASVEQIFIALFNGAVLVLVDKNTLIDYIKFEKFMICQSITHIHAVPSFLNGLQLKDTYNYGLKRIISGGDVCPVGLAERWSADYDFYNEYGPTESTVTSIEMLIDAVDKRIPRLPVGKPISNTRVYVSDKGMNLVPIGVVGDLYVGGAGVSRGYLNNPELTKEKFEHDFWDYQDDLDEEEKDTSKKYHKKFLRGESRCFTGAVFSKSAPPGCRRHRTYKTGDLARWFPGGNIEFFGRKDSQVKIRGFRIELGEIENRLLAHADIKEVVVLCREDRMNDKYLYAFIVPYSPGVINKTTPAFLELREYLSQSLPEYMLPRYFMELEKIPLTPNGKIDRKALLELQVSDPGLSNEYEAPRDEIEEKLAGLWSEVLSIEKEKISIHDNFFQLGGHSLKATLMTAKIHKALDVYLPLAEIFRRPSIRQLSEFLKRSVKYKFLSIGLSEKMEYYALSSAQKRLFVLQQLAPGSTVYNMPIVITPEGEINKKKLEETFRKLIARHESLRTSFEIINEETVQRVHDEVIFKIDYYQVEFDLKVKEIIKNFTRPFDLSKAPLLRVGLVRTIPREHFSPAASVTSLFHELTTKKNIAGQDIMLLDMHHIISDEISMKILVNDFAALYTGKTLPSLRLQYKDYTQWKYRENNMAAQLKQAAFWQEQFQGEIPVLELPIDFPRPEVQNFEGNRVHFEIIPEETQRLKKLVLKEGTTLYMVLLTVFNVFLSKITNQETFIVGTVVAGRRHADLKQIMGMFVNTLALNNHPGNQRYFKDFLKEVSERTLEAFENQDYPFEELVEKISTQRDGGRNPLFDVMFTLQDLDIDTIQIPGLKPEPYDHNTNTSKFDLMFQAIEKKENLSFIVEYSTKLFKETTIKLFISYFKKIVAVTSVNPTVELGEIEIIPESEKKQILFQFNNNLSEYPKDNRIHRLFEENVEKSPDIAALVYNFQILTYRDLDQLANQLAGHFRDRGIEPEAPVGIMLEASAEMIVTVLAALKVGGAYLPIDPYYPLERIKLMLRESSVQLVVTSRSCTVTGADLGVIRANFDKEILYLEDFLMKFGVSSDYCLPSVPDSNLAYIIYTSGSTGKPKGVMVEHQSVIRLVKNTNFIDFKSDDRILQTGALEFDASTFEIWGALLNGLTLYLADKNEILTPGTLKKIIANNQITTIWFTSPLFNQLVQSDVEIFAGLRNLLVGGDVLSPPHINQVRKHFPRLHIINGYGPTENTTFSTTFLIDREYKAGIPIGKPIANSTAYIVDKNERLQPIGIAGELYVGGDGLSRGYLNKPELTVGKFIEQVTIVGDSWETISNKQFFGRTRWQFLQKEPPGRRKQKIYKTGDLTRWLPDGNIEFLGRIDHQVKVRGYRIELVEIENNLLKTSKIREALVITRDIKGEDKYLCAYMVSDEEINISYLREQLSTHLPDYMIPSYFMQIERIPLTPNGKIDRKALPVPKLKVEEDYTPPGDPVDEKMVGIWSEVLGMRREVIGIDSNFFKLGGHSLRAIVMVAKIHKTFNVELPLVEIFNRPTIRRLVGYVKEALAEEEETYASIEMVEKKEYYLLSSAQKRLFLLQQMDEESTVYNIPLVIQPRKIISKAKVEKTFRQLIQRHESFRISFAMIAGEAVQQVHDEVEFEIKFFSIGHRAHGTERTSIAQDSGLYANTINAFIHPFDLSRAPLLRVGLIEREDKKYLLMVDMHHVISDGTSIKILMEEFTILYEGGELPEMRIQYKDYALWQASEKVKEKVKNQETFWLNEFFGEIPLLELPWDYSRPMVQSFEGSCVRFEIEAEELVYLKQLAFQERATLYMTLLAIFNILLSKLSSQEDIVIGSAVVGRRHFDLQHIIGMLVNTLALRNFPDGEKSFKRFLSELKTRMLEAFENQDYQFEDLVEKVAVKRDASRNPLFDVMMALQNMGNANTEFEAPGIGDRVGDGVFEEIAGQIYESQVSRFDLTFSGTEFRGRLLFAVEYCSRLFKRESIERFISYFKRIMECVLGDPGISIGDINILSEDERIEILYDFNDTEAACAIDKTIIEQFRYQVGNIPHHIALICGEQQLTYGALNQKINQLGNQLRKKGVGPNFIVGLMLERSIQMIEALLAILEAGGAYLPIDPNYPEDRVHYMLEDSESRLLLTRSHLSASFGFSAEVVDVEIAACQDKCRNFQAINHPDDLIYMIYTSGSTGKPKGTMVKIRGFLNLLQWYTVEFEMGAVDHNLLIAPISFDLTQKNLFSPIISGGRLILASPGIPDYLEESERIEKNQITIINCAPGVFYPFIEFNSDSDFVKLRSLRQVFLGGAPIKANKLLPLVNSKSFHGEIVNTYGPTECTDVVSFYPISRATLNQRQMIPIGKPLPNIKLLILSKNQKLLPITLAGELCIGGIGLSVGYCNNPELTVEKFIEVPGLLGKSIYRTGDLARWLPDGNIEFLGRNDQQVKIRGLRIELGEIESQLLRHSDIKEAVVAAKTHDSGDKYLCAYLISVSGIQVDVEELREFLSLKLPNFMIPSYFVQLVEIPMTPNGKINYGALPTPEEKSYVKYIAPRNNIERKLVNIWSEVMKIDKDIISIDSDFFDLGGHSLQATVLTAKIHKELDVKVPLAEIFKIPTIRGFSAYIQGAAGDKYTAIKTAEAKEYYDISSAQKRMYFMQQIDLASTAYNIGYFAILDKGLDEEILKKTIQKLITRHESLRTSFEMIANEPIQKIHKFHEVKFEIEVHETGGETVEEFARRLVKPFELSKVPLFSVNFIKYEKTRYLLFFDIHHIVTDGISQRILLNDINRLSDGKELPPLRIHYKDYTEWQKMMIKSGVLKQQEEYWLRQFREEIPVLQLLTDYPRPEKQSFEGDQIDLNLNPEITEKIMNTVKETGVTLNIFLLALYNVLLAKYSGQEDIIVGIPIAGRRHSDLQQIIGMFINMLPIRNQPNQNKTFKEFLAEVKQNSINAYENQDYQFDDLVLKLGLQRNRNRNPIFDTVFVVQNFAMTNQNYDDNIEEKDIHINPGISQFDLIFEALEANNSINMIMLYSTALFKKSSVERMVKQYIEILKQVVENLDLKLQEIIITHDFLMAESNGTSEDQTDFRF